MQNEQQQQQESMVNRAWSGMEGTYQNVTDQASHLRESAETYTQEAPLTATLVSFGVGIGLGLLVSQLLGSSQPRRPQRWYDSYIGDNRARSMEDTLHRYVPESISRRMGM
jgi:hypothetical protein